jgi:hypothetical protein
MPDSPKEKNTPEPVATPIGQPDKHGNTSSKMPMPVFVLAVAAVLALIVFGWIVANEMLNGKPLPNTSLSTGLPKSDPNTNNDTGDAPLSILPGEPAGVTLLEKQPEPSGPAARQLAPIAQGADVATGFAMDLGAASSFLELSRRFSSITLTNGPENFQRLEPRAILTDTVTGLEARLLVGPFETESEAGDACSILQLPEGITCKTALFEGELIARE